MYNFIDKRGIFLSISGLFVGASILALILFGLKLGLDFTGGTMIEIGFPNFHPEIKEIQKKLTDFKLGEIRIQSIDKKTIILRLKTIDEETHQKILTTLGPVEEKRFESIGPIIGRELTEKAKWAVILAVLAILVYIAWIFRRLSRLIKKGESWRYAGGATLALIHDILVVLGLFALLGKFKGVEINTSFIIAILTVLGYSVNDTIVVYDRIRENLLNQSAKNFEDFKELINRSLNETIIRTLNTTITTLLALLAILFFGGETLRYFILAMMVGIATGAWSSFSIAVPFLLFGRKKFNHFSGK